MKLRFPISKLDYLLTQSEWIGTFIRNGWIWIWAQSWSASAKSVTIEFSHLSSLSQPIEECVLQSCLELVGCSNQSDTWTLKAPWPVLPRCVVVSPDYLSSAALFIFSPWLRLRWLGLVTTAMINVSKNQTLSPVIAHHRTCQSCLYSS